MSQESSQTPPRRLEIAASLFERLADEGIRYIHWKSNEHLAAALRGETDLDLLILESDAEAFRRVIDSLGFVALRAVRGRRVAGLEGYLGFDGRTGSLLHLDVHRRLVLGERLVKNHHLPLEEWLLSDPATAEGVSVPQPARELLLLYIRSMLKTTWRPLVRSAIRGGSPIPERIRREAAWLASQVEPSDLESAVESSGLALAIDEVVEFRERALTGRFDPSFVRAKRKGLLKRMRRYQRQPRLIASMRKAWLRTRSTSPAKRLGWGLPPRTLVRRAPVVAVVGADGSGKTRLTRDLEAWLVKKLRVRHLYFGQPKRKGVFWLLNKPGRLVRRLGGSNNAVTRSAAAFLRPVTTMTDAVKWIVLGERRRRLSRRARRAGQAGVLVLAERFPLRQFWTMAEPMDGPRLGGPQAGLLSRAETRSYEAVEVPDLVLALKTDLKTLRSRKVDLTMEEHSAKVEAVSSLNSGDRLVVVDAGQPYDRVVLEAKQAVWDAILATR